MPSAREWLALGGSIALCFAVAGLGSLFTTPAIAGGWYAALQRPAWSPPNWVFGPVWTLLYLSMAVAAWLVWRERGFSGAAWPLAFFAAQLLLNAAWSPLFFGAKQLGWAFVEIVFMWAAILATLVSFWRVSAWAGGLLVPYQLWVTFAAALNFAIWRMN